MLSKRLLKAVAILEKSGVKVTGASRLLREATILSEVHAARSFPVGIVERRRVAYAVHDALEFRKVLRSFSNAELRQLVPEIKLAIKGTTDREDQARKAYQFQSQLYVGCILGAGGLKPRVPISSGRPSPDYIITVTSRDYAVEVKRPQSEEAIENAMRKANEQIRGSGLKGGVVIDVTDCIEKETLFLDADEPELPPYHLVEGDKERLLERCRDAVSDETKKNHRVGFESLLFLLVYFNGWRWTRKGPRGPEPFTGLLFQSLATVPGSLESWHARDFYNAFTDGWKANGLFISRETGPED